MLANAGRLWRTVRHLKPVQIYGRIGFRLARPTPDCSSPPALRAVVGNWTETAKRRPSMTGPDSFCFLNEEGSLANGWDDPSQAKLWRYNLHYFDDLNAVDAQHRREWHTALIERWVAENPPGDGSGWEPYPTSLRIVNWVKWALAGNPLSPAATKSLAVQARWLAKRLEWHILGNHLLANAKALAFAGLYFEDAEAEAWLKTGTDILLEQLPEQILADGGHFELSPMYHALAVEDVLDLANLADAYSGSMVTLREAFSEHLPKMLRWLRTMCHPDGEIAFFNDAAMGIAPSPAELEAYGRRVGFAFEPSDGGSLLLEASGYARLEVGNAVLIADIAQVGADYLPGHGHADTLSFELSLYGHRMIVNSGTSVYGIGDERLRQRGTAAHSTVSIDDKNSSEVWSSFRVGRRARVKVEQFEDATLIASHDGYAHLLGAPRHRRTWQLADDKMVIVDEITGTGLHDVKLHFHCAPWIHVASRESGSSIPLENRKTGQICNMIVPAGTWVEVAMSSWHPEFGLSVPSTQLCVGWHGELPFRHETSFAWSLP